MKGGKAMFRFNGGQEVGKGTYWNLTNGEGLDMEATGVLPGGGSVKYLKLPSSGMFVLGPLFGLLFVVLIPFLTALVALLLLARAATASEALGSEEAAMCLGCHSAQGMVKTFGNKEKVAINIGERDFKGTVHGFVTCTGCHDVSMESHPSASYASKRDFALAVSKSCGNCHAEDQLMAKPTHRQAIRRANAPPCSDCHGFHAIKRVSEWKKQMPQASQYCLTCHKKQISISVGGENLSLSVNEEDIRKSVHSNHNCTDCHKNFSTESHPVEKFGSRRELSISISEACKGCHEDKASQFAGSIHASMLKDGNLKAPVCTDCHGFHSVGRTDLANTIKGVPCKKCHESIFEDYAASVHGLAKSHGKNSAAICSSCHFAHEVKPTHVSMSPREACLGCHKKAEELHSDWLPNAGIHLEAVACTACHVPDSGKKVYLNIMDKASGEILSEARVKELLGPTMANQPVPLAGRQIWDIYSKLSDGGVRASIRGTLSIDDSRGAHRLAHKEKAVRDCDSCHSAGSGFFKAVSMVVRRQNGAETYLSVNPQVLGSIFSVLPMSQFYALGSTRVKALDYLGVFMIVAGASFPAVHIMVRILTRNLRSSGKHKGGR